jgi:hypothetical protein
MHLVAGRRRHGHGRELSVVRSFFARQGNASSVRRSSSICLGSALLCAVFTSRAPFRCDVIRELPMSSDGDENRERLLFDRSSATERSAIFRRSETATRTTRVEILQHQISEDTSEATNC